MRWAGRRQSQNVEDRRGMSPKLAVGGGAGIIILLLGLLLGGGDLGSLINLGTQTQMVPNDQPVDPASDPQREFVGVVLADTEEIWGHLFAQDGQTYREPKVVLFSGQVESACGFASAASGPFYCPPDENVYLDLSFFEQMSSKFGATGDFAAAYVIAHEIGHHVQKQLGVTDQMERLRGAVSEEEYNQMSVRLELQADYLAGVFAHHAQTSLNVIEPGDIDEALRTASAIGDDRLQKQAQGYVVPESFTHGTAEQRAAWFRRGFETGDLSRGDTFNMDYGDL